MGVRESLLNTITSVADSDFVRIVTSAGASSKATVRNLFKGFESNLGAKSSLTTSDYIRVVGTDNVSYKQLVSDVAKKIIENYTGSSLAGSSQSVKSALDALNSKTTRAPKTVTVSSSKINSVVANADQVGHLVVISFYFTATSAISRGETLYTIDLPANFARNYFNGKINLATNTKEVRADATIASGEVVSGTYVGLLL